MKKAHLQVILNYIIAWPSFNVVTLISCLGSPREPIKNDVQTQSSIDAKTGNILNPTYGSLDSTGDYN